MQIGMWFGYVTFGLVANAIGRKRAYAVFVIAASMLLPLYGYMRSPGILLALGPFVAFFGTGYYSGFGPLTAENLSHGHSGHGDGVSGFSRTVNCL
jgi:MFS family permease